MSAHPLIDPTNGIEYDPSSVALGRAAAAASRRTLYGADSWNEAWWRGDRDNQHHWIAVARAVLAEAAAQPPAPITAEDVRAAERAWRGRPADQEHEIRAAFVADHLNRRGEQ